VPESVTDRAAGEMAGAEPIGTVTVFPNADNGFRAENVVLVVLAE